MRSTVNKSGLVVEGQVGSPEVIEALISYLEGINHKRARMFRYSYDVKIIYYGYLWLWDDLEHEMNQLAGMEDGVMLFFGQRPGTTEWGFWPITLVEETAAEMMPLRR